MYIRNMAKQKRKNAYVKAKYAGRKEILKGHVEMLREQLHAAEREVIQLQQAEQVEMYGMTRNWFLSKARAARSWKVEHEGRSYSVLLEGYRLVITMTEESQHWIQPVSIVIDAVAYVGRNDYGITVYFPKGGSRHYTAYNYPIKYRNEITKMEKIMRDYQIIENE